MFGKCLNFLINPIERLICNKNKRANCWFRFLMILESILKHMDKVIPVHGHDGKDTVIIEHQCNLL